MYKTAIKYWAEDDRPREKLLLKGPESLSLSELIAILINNGTKEKSAVDLAKELLQKTNNNLEQLGQLSVKELVQLKVKGLGEAKAISIVAALELGIRRAASISKKIAIVQSADVAQYLKAQLEFKAHEVFGVLLLNRANKILHFELISEGGFTGTVADPKMIIKTALAYNAVNIILCHNHPSGNLKPSKADEQITERIKEAASLLDIQLLDHIIVSKEGYFSFADEGML